MRRQRHPVNETLFVTPRTIEHHLRSVYGKLAIASREQLSAALTEDRD